MPMSASSGARYIGGGEASGERDRVSGQDRARGPFTPDRLGPVMRQAYVKARLPSDCPTHGLHYTAATVLREIGCDDRTIGDVLGHVPVEITRNYAAKRRRFALAVTRLDKVRKQRRASAKNAGGTETVKPD
jgi:integrase